MSLPAKRASAYPAILDVHIREDKITAILSDGREISIPIAWFSRLASANEAQIQSFEISPGGYGIHWLDLDEDISVKAFLD